MIFQDNSIQQKTVKHALLFVIAISLLNCQPILKAPAAAIYSAILPTPEIDTLKKQYPIANFNLQVTGLDEKLVKMKDYKGKVVFLNFWATWCMPCVAELPSINKLYNQFKNEDIVFLLISNEDIAKVRNYKKNKNYDVPFFIEDNNSNIPIMYYSNGIPTTFIINKKGEVIKASVGAENWDDKEFIKTVRNLVQ